MSEWDRAKELLEGVRPYEDGYEKHSVHRLIDAGDKLKRKLVSIKQVTDKFLDGESTPTNLIREITEACDALNDIRDILGDTDNE